MRWSARSATAPSVTIAFPYVYLDATYIKVRDPELHQVVVQGRRRGHRDHRGRQPRDPRVWPSATAKTETFWSEFLRSLKRRGLAGVRLVISDAHEGLKAAIVKNFQGSSWQRCRVHFARNVLAKVPKASQDVVAAALRTVFVHPSAPEVSKAWDGVRRHVRTAVPQSRRR